MTGLDAKLQRSVMNRFHSSKPTNSKSIPVTSHRVFLCQYYEININILTGV